LPGSPDRLTRLASLDRNDGTSNVVDVYVRHPIGRTDQGVVVGLPRGSWPERRCDPVRQMAAEAADDSVVDVLYAILDPRVRLA
jgi:hypothetical protein